jgi:hypothetical protein
MGSEVNSWFQVEEMERKAGDDLSKDYREEAQGVCIYIFAMSR